MATLIYTPDQTRVEIQIGQPKCSCGSDFHVFKHTATRKKRFLGITANCENPKCKNYEPFIADTEAEMLGVLMSNSI
jgi:hypothetical protein